jgi:thiopurine S-methyltransferase
MEAEFWHERWEKNEIGFHQQEFNRHLMNHAHRLELVPGAHVLVPLCGKSLDLLWLAAKGFRVSGIELSERAVEELFIENDLAFKTRAIPGGRLYSHRNLSVYCMDFFDFDLELIPRPDAVYDRASLVALPAGMRPDYCKRLAAMMPVGCRSLLVTLDYPPDEMNGPPFAVSTREVRALLEAWFEFDLIHSEDCLPREPRFAKKGLTYLHEHVMLLSRLAAPVNSRLTGAGPG